MNIEKVKTKRFYIPIFEYSRAGDIAILTILGIPVYRKVGAHKKILFWTI
jgi:hypothetical protein